MKTAAIELRVTSLNRQRSHTQRLVSLLLDDQPPSQHTGEVTCGHMLTRGLQKQKFTQEPQFLSAILRGFTTSKSLIIFVRIYLFSLGFAFVCLHYCIS